MTTRWAGCLLALLTAVVPTAGAAQQTADVPDSVVYARIDSAMNMALNGSTNDERTTGVIGVLSLGQRWYRGHPGRQNQPPPRIRYPGLVDRVETIYEATEDPLLRRFIVRHVRFQSERDQAIQFLMRVARSRTRPSDRRLHLPHDLAHEALQSLVAMGDRGMAALQRLHAEGSVKSGLARIYLEKIKKNGWRPLSRDRP